MVVSHTATAVFRAKAKSGSCRKKDNSLPFYFTLAKIKLQYNTKNGEYNIFCSCNWSCFLYWEAFCVLNNNMAAPMSF